MASENETVMSVCAEWRDCIESADPSVWNDARIAGLVKTTKAQQLAYLDRVEAAWKREREELDKRISDLEAYAKLWTGRADELRLKCDEFYAKAKSVGNAAAMREALVKCREIALQWQADEADGVAGTTDKPSARSAAEAVIDMEFEINAALALPLRQCDVGTAEEQKERFDEFCNNHWGSNDRSGNNCGMCPLSPINCLLAWAQMPYEAEEGGTV